MATIARATGVSQGAISSLLNDRNYGIRVSPATRERIFRVCRELGYIPNDLRAVVRMYPEQGDLAVLWSNDAVEQMHDCFGQKLLIGARSALGDHSRAITLCTFDPAADYLSNDVPLPHPLQRGTATKIILVGRPSVSLLQVLEDRQLAIVLLDSSPNGRGGVHIQPDYVSAARLAIEHLHHRGHRRIGILAGKRGAADLRSEDLAAGVKQAFEELGLSLDRQSFIHPGFTFEDGRAGISTLLRQGHLPTALFCFTDNAAAGALSRLHASGIRVPEDVSIIGCDGGPWSSRLIPTLTTLELPLEEMGRRAVEEAEARASRHSEHGNDHILMPVRLAIRGSTGPAAR